MITTSTVKPSYADPIHAKDKISSYHRDCTMDQSKENASNADYDKTIKSTVSSGR